MTDIVPNLSTRVLVPYEMKEVSFFLYFLFFIHNLYYLLSYLYNFSVIVEEALEQVTLITQFILVLYGWFFIESLFTKTILLQ